MKRGFFLTESFRLLLRGVKVAFQGLYGTWRFSYLKEPVVSIFGGSNTPAESEYGKKARDLSRMLVENYITIITGGGPGIMEAANCGAQDAAGADQRARTLGLRVSGVDAGFENQCTPTIEFRYLSQRKWFLVQFSCAYIFFPGGIGTMDEFFHLLDLMKLDRIPRVPVIMIGTSYWAKIREWFVDFGIQQKLIPADCEDLFMITDDLQEVIDILKKNCFK